MSTYLEGGFAVIVMLQTLTIITAQYKLVCSYSSTDSDRFNVDRIDPHLCTHIIYGSFSITREGHVKTPISISDIQSFEEKIQKFIDLKKENPKLKLLAEFNGPSISSRQFTEVSGDPDKRLILRASVTNFTVSYGFDGITLDSGFLVPVIATSAEKENFVELLRDLKEEFHEPELLLTATFWAHASLPRENYNIGEIMKYLNFANLVILNHQNFNFTTHIAPLYSSSSENHSSPKQQIVNDSISYWLDEGAPSEKLLVGLPIFGQTFELKDKSVNGMMAPTSGPGNPGPHLQLTGMFSYSDICENLKTENWTLGWDNEQKVPFAYNGYEWVGYEDLRSIQLKTQYVKNHRLGGMMVWSLDMDDFLGTCGEKFPLLKMVNENLLGAIDPECEPFIDVAQPRPLCDQQNLGPNDDCKVFYVCDKGKKFTFRIL